MVEFYKSHKKFPLVLPGFLLLVSIGIATVMAALGEKNNGFLPAAGNVPQQFLAAVIKENYAGVEKIESKVLRYQGLYIFDFNTKSLCGDAGCLYAVYVGNDKSSFYLKSPRFEFADNCFTASDKDGDSVLANRYCYQAGRLNKVLSQKHE